MTTIEVARIFGVDVGSRRTKIKGGYLALCPVHGDSKPSMTIKEGKRCVLVGCLSHNCDLADICKAVGISRRALWYDAETKMDSKTWAEAQKKRRDKETAEATANRELRLWHQKVNRWEQASAAAFTAMMGLGRTPEALYAADLWHQALNIARLYRERLWTLQKPHGVQRSKLGEVYCWKMSGSEFERVAQCKAERQEPDA